MSEPQFPQEPPKSLHSHYARLACGTVYPAFTNGPGYQDAATEDWRPATPQEISDYINGVVTMRKAMEFHPDGATKTTGSGVVGNLGGVIQLTPEDEPVPAIDPAFVAPPPAEAPVAIVIPPAP